MSDDQNKTGDETMGEFGRITLEDSTADLAVQNLLAHAQSSLRASVHEAKITAQRTAKMLLDRQRQEGYWAGDLTPTRLFNPTTF